MTSINIEIPPIGLEIVHNPYKKPDSKCLKGALIRGEWTDQIQSFILKNSLEALYFNRAKGWKGSNFHFLIDMKLIKELHIISTKAEGLEAIELIDILEDFSFTGSTRSIIDFSNFLKLKKCFLSWWSGANSIFDCISLESLYLDKLKIKDYTIIEKLKNLQVLKIGNSTIDTLSWLNNLNNIQELELLNCRKLANFTPIANSLNLSKLTIDGSKGLIDLDFLSQLNNLEVLNISNNGEVASLAPLEALKSLKAVCFSGNTIIKDGNLSVLEGLPKLSMLMFQGRRHYSHKLIKAWSWKNFDYPDILLKSI